MPTRNTSNIILLQRHKECRGCGQVHVTIDESQTKTEGGLYWWNCPCHSTLAIPIKETITEPVLRETAMVWEFRVLTTKNGELA